MASQVLANDLNELGQRLGLWRQAFIWNGKGYELNEPALLDIVHEALDRIPPKTNAPGAGQISLDLG